MGAGSPLVSVIIPCYNHGRFLADAVESALAQTHAPVEVIVVDDGSTDNTRRVAEGYGARIRYVHQANAGLSAARNTGIKHASGEYLQFLDADDRLLPEKIARQLALFEREPGLGAVYCWYHRTSEHNERIETVVGPPRRGDIYHPLRCGNWILAHTVLVRASCVREAGPFDVGLDACEDWDMWLRIALRHPFDLVEEPLVECRDTTGSMSKNAKRMFRARLQVLRLRARDHRRCAECRRADAVMRYEQSVVLREHAWRSLRGGDLGGAWLHYALAIRLRPAMLGDRHLIKDLLSLGKQAARVRGSAE